MAKVQQNGSMERWTPYPVFSFGQSHAGFSGGPPPERGSTKFNHHMKHSMGLEYVPTLTPQTTPTDRQINGSLRECLGHRKHARDQVHHTPPLCQDVSGLFIYPDSYCHSFRTHRLNLPFGPPHFTGPPDCGTPSLDGFLWALQETHRATESSPSHPLGAPNALSWPPPAEAPRGVKPWQKVEVRARDGHSTGENDPRPPLGPLRSLLSVTLRSMRRQKHESA